MESDTAWVDLDSDEIDSVSSDDLHRNRPNRLLSDEELAWEELTKEERDLWASMADLHRRDLAVHLYNAIVQERGKLAAQDQDLLADTGNGQDAEEVKMELKMGDRPGSHVPTVEDENNSGEAKMEDDEKIGEGDSGEGNSDEATMEEWTAWPSTEGRLPNEGLFKQPDTDDETELFTNCKKEEAFPNSDLHEELAAFILKVSKRRFMKRMSKTVQQSVEGDAPSESDTSETSEDDATVKADSVLGSLETDTDDDDKTPSERAKGKTYDPMVSADDDFSYRILQPSVRHILSLLDKTLNILLIETATVDNSSQHSPASPESTTATTDTDYASESRREADGSELRRTGRPRKRWQPGEYASSRSADFSPGGSRTGHSRKVRTPLEGETHEEMLVRVARTGHRHPPPGVDAEFREWLQKGDEVIARSRSMSLQQEKARAQVSAEGDTEADAVEGVHQAASVLLKREESQERMPEVDDTEMVDIVEEVPREGGRKAKRARSASSERDESPLRVPEEDEAATTADDESAWVTDGEAEMDTDDEALKDSDDDYALTDWQDVIRAAALAGFSSEVITRTAKRCADLFGEGTVIHGLDEGDAVSAVRGMGIRTAEYRPEPIRNLESDVSSLSSRNGGVDSNDENADHSRSDNINIGDVQLSTDSDDYEDGYVDYEDNYVAIDSEDDDEAVDSEAEADEKAYDDYNDALSQVLPRGTSSPPPGHFFCPVLSCERSPSAFASREHLQQHISTSHPDRYSEGDEMAKQRKKRDGVESESEGEAESIGGMRVDGFLKRPLLPKEEDRKEMWERSQWREKKAVRRAKNRKTSTDSRDSSV